jgi:ribonuclease HI
MFDLVAFIDGGSLGNPGPAGVGVVIEGAERGKIRIGRWIGRQDNNMAEYVALLEALQWAVSLKARKLHVFSDSEVVVRQMSGQYNCRSSRLYSVNWVCRKLARSLDFTISHVRRESNTEANSLAAAAARNRF